MHDARSSDLARTTAVHFRAETAGLCALSTVVRGLHGKGLVPSIKALRRGLVGASSTGPLRGETFRLWPHDVQKEAELRTAR